MQTAETVLNAIRKRGQRQVPLLNGTYKLLLNPNLYLRTYVKIYSNNGALTPGVDLETADGMNEDKISTIIKALRFERYWWKPVRRVYIPKANGKRRALGLPAWSDKLLQEVIRSLIEAYYEPQFSKYSHGFRPNHGCHTALQQIQAAWTGTKWFVEGDIEGYFDNINHNKLLEILAKNMNGGGIMYHEGG